MSTNVCAMAGNGGAADGDETLTIMGFKNVPKGNWVFKATSTGDSFPGFSNDVIPLAMNTSASGGDHDQTNGGGLSCSGTASINGKEACYSHGSFRGTQFTGHTHPVWVDSSARANSVFLPWFYNMDLTAVQNGIKSGTITAWMQKVQDL